MYNKNDADPTSHFPVTGLESRFDFIAFSFCLAKQQLEESIMTKGYIFTYVFLEDTLKHSSRAM